jgi:hypothetical protein
MMNVDHPGNLFGFKMRTGSRHVDWISCSWRGSVLGEFIHAFGLFLSHIGKPCTCGDPADKTIDNEIVISQPRRQFAGTLEA